MDPVPLRPGQDIVATDFSSSPHDDIWNQYSTSTFATTTRRGLHRGLQLAQPILRPDIAIGRGTITRHDVLGGIVHEYERAA
ncbi:MAG: hypothetical protein ACYCS7_04575 [Acidimicrobiales bacterium]